MAGSGGLASAAGVGGVAGSAGLGAGGFVATGAWGAFGAAAEGAAFWLSAAELGMAEPAWASVPAAHARPPAEAVRRRSASAPARKALLWDGHRASASMRNSRNVQHQHQGQQPRPRQADP